MPFLTNRKLNQHGFAHHFLVPVVAIVAVVGIGALVELRLSAAATTSCSTPTTPAIVTGNSGTCVQYAQQMVNGILAYMYLNSNGSDLTSRTNTVNNVINKWPLAKLDSAANFDVDNGFAALNATYGKQTGTNKINNVSHSDPYWVGQIQRDITSSSTETGRGFGGVSLTPFGKPSASGNVDNATWGMLCDASNHIQATSESNQNNSTDYAKGTSNKLAMWFVRSYMRAGISAASGANCSGILNPPKTTPPPAGKTGWTLTGTATLGKSTVAGGKATVPFTASVMNTGSASATFQYKTFYFFYDQPKGKTSTWPSPVNGAYAGETAITNDTATVAAGKSFSKSTSAANASFPATKNYASGDLVYLCVGIAFPASSTASTTLNGRSTVTGNQCVKVETGTGSAGGGGTAAPATGNATVNFSKNLNTPALNTYSIGDTISTYKASDGSTISTSAAYRNTLAALGPLAWRVPLRMVNGVPTGAGAGGGGTGYVQAIKQMNGVPVVITAGQTGDNDFNDAQITNLVKYYNAGAGQNGGPVTSWIIGNEPGINNTGVTPVNGSYWTPYVNMVPGVVNALKAGDPNRTLQISAGAVFTQDLIGTLKDVAVNGITTLGWHGYEAGDNNIGQYAGPLYLGQEQQAAALASKYGKLSGVEEFNWNASCPNNGQDGLFIASVIGNVLAGGGVHAYMYDDTNGNNGCDTLSSATNGQRPAYWALGMWTGMNGKFDRFGSNLVDTTVTSNGKAIDVTNAGGKEAAGLAHEVELFATSNGKILAINENTGTNETMNIGIGGLAAGNHAYKVWQTNAPTGPGGAPKEVVTNGSVKAGGILSITLPAGTISSIDVTP